MGITMENIVEEYSKSRGTRFVHGKGCPQKIHFWFQKMAKMNFLKTNGSNLAEKYINEQGIT